MVDLLIIFQVAVAVITVTWVVSNIMNVNKKAIAIRLSRVPAMKKAETVVTHLRPKTQLKPAYPKVMWTTESVPLGRLAEGGSWGQDKSTRSVLNRKIVANQPQ